MARRSGPYKRYLESDTERIPRRTKFRWNAKSSQEDGWLHVNNEDDDHSLLNVYNYDEHDPRNTRDDRSNTSKSEDEINKLGNEDFKKDVEEHNSEDDDDEVNSENSSTTSLLGTDIQEIDNEDDQTNTENNMSNASNSGDEEDEMDNENSSTASLLGTDIQENEEDLSDSEESMLNDTWSEAGNDVDSEDLMECNTGGENTSVFSVIEPKVILLKAIKYLMQVPSGCLLN
ncbi:hypothetical protein AOLI_G00202710 [Acnodon oligacanthus]